MEAVKKVRSTVVEEFWTWCQNAEPGESHSYYRGLTVWHVTDEIGPKGQRLHAKIPAAQAAWEAYRLGHVNLVQKRNHDPLPERQRYPEGTPFTFFAQRRPLGSKPPEGVTR